MVSINVIETDVNEFRNDFCALIDAYREAIKEANVIRAYHTDCLIDLWAICRDGRIDDHIVIGLRDTGTQLIRTDDDRFKADVISWEKAFGTHKWYRYNSDLKKFERYSIVHEVRSVVA